MIHIAEKITTDLDLPEVDQPSFFEEFIASFDWNVILQKMISSSVRIIFVLLVFFIFHKVASWGIELFFDQYSKKHKSVTNRYQTVYRITFNIFNSIFYFFLVYTILEILSFPVGTLLASAGIVGLAISLGAQGFVSDLVNGITILMERQIDIGDSVTLNELSGNVLNVNLRTTQIKDFDGTIHFIPNREINIISNHSKGDMRARIDVRLYPDADIESIRRIVDDINEEYIPQFEDITVPPSDILFVASDKNQLTLRVNMYTKAGSQYGVMYKFYELYVSRLTEAGIKLPFSELEISQ